MGSKADTGDMTIHDRIAAQRGEKAPRRTGWSRLAALAVILLMIAGSLFLWIGMPLLWLWLGSQLTESTQAVAGPYALVAVGIVLSAVAIYRALYGLNVVHGRLTGTTPSSVRVQRSWMGATRRESHSGQPLTALEVILVASVAVALLLFLVWFFFYSGSPLSFQGAHGSRGGK